ncbi:MAG: type II secretion system F family protein [Nitrospirae bacterium]|nr:type II secretion system F family protein [Nitrospirota bacterium]
MPKFSWEGKTVGGEARAGTIDAPSLDVARTLLERRRIEISKLKAEASFLSGLKLPGFFKGSVSEKELAVFTRQVSTMIDAGVPILQTMEIMSSQAANKYFSKVIQEIRGDISAGASLAQALKRHPRIFPDLYVNLVGSGEQSGALPTILNRLAVQIEKTVKLKSMIKKAMMYPSAVVVVAVGVMTLMLTWVMPKFEGIFEGLGGQLPPLTQVVLGLSHFMVDNLILFFGGIAGGVILFGLAMRNETFRHAFHAFRLKWPILGMLFRKAALARFGRTLGTMVSGGIPILDALQVVARATGDLVVQTSVMKLRDELAKGKTLSEPMFKDKLFPPMVSQMVQVGENTGQLEGMLGKVADYYEEEVDVAVAGLSSLIEPVLIVVLGGGVGIIILAMYMPIFKVGQLI